MSDINKYSILDIDGAADVVNNLLDKLGTAVGWGVNRETPERIAIATYIEDIKNNRQIYELIENREIQKVVFL